MSTTDILRGLFGNGSAPCQCSADKGDRSASAQGEAPAPLSNGHQAAGEHAPTAAAQNGTQAMNQNQNDANGQVNVTREIDVSHLPPPLPMVRILETLRELGDGETLVVRHTRRPIHLYPKLEELGCTHETIERSPKQIEVLITKPSA